MKTEEAECSLVHHGFVKDLKQTDAILVGHLTQDAGFQT